MKGWEPLFNEVKEKEYYRSLMEFIDSEYQNEVVYPPKEDVFRAFETLSYQEVKVVILGQDPYHQPHQAMGLSFSVPKGVKIPPSLRNIYKELFSDLGINNQTGDLSSWAKQGVFLLNAVLTVRASQPLSHQKKGWETFTDEVIAYLSAREEPMIFILWGSFAQSKLKMIGAHHKVITGAHPSPLSAYRGFFGSKPFSRVNHMLKTMGKKEIDWSV